MTNTDLLQCEWPGCHETYVPFPRGLMPQARDFHEDGWLLAYCDDHLSCCPAHAEQGEAYNHARSVARSAYVTKVTERFIELSSHDPQLQTLIDEIRQSGIRYLEVSLTLAPGKDRP